MQLRKCPRCGLVLEGRHVTCQFCGAVVMSPRSLQLVVLAVAAMFILLIGLVAAQLFVLHRGTPPPAAETGAGGAR